MLSISFDGPSRKNTLPACKPCGGDRRKFAFGSLDHVAKSNNDLKNRMITIDLEGRRLTSRPPHASEEAQLPQPSLG